MATRRELQRQRRLAALEGDSSRATNRDAAARAPASAQYLFPQGVTIDTAVFPNATNLTGTGAASVTGSNVDVALPLVPPLHASTHAAAGSDPVTLSESQITNLVSDLAGKAASSHSHTEADISLSDVTTDDVSTSRHGFAPKAPNDTNKFLRGDASYAIPSGTWIKRTTYGAGSGTHTPDSKAATALADFRGPGGAGGGVTGASSAAAAAGGGGGGGRAVKRAAVSGTYSYAVGTGGTAGTAGANPGNNGSAASTFSGTNFSLSGGLGVGGSAMAQGSSVLIAAGGTGGAATGGDVNDAGAPGNQGIRLSGSVGASGFGGASGNGGNGAPGRLTNGAGTTAASPGGGGSGAGSNNNSNSLSGGAGADGNGVVDEWT